MKKKCEKITMLEGSTGSGKTHRIICMLKNHLKRSDSGVIKIVALNSKDSVNRLYADVADSIVEKGDLIRYISGRPEVSPGLIVKQLKKTFTPPKVILTTHAYLKKRGFSTFMYMFHLDMLWLSTTYQVKLDLIIDEGHLFLDSLSWDLKIGGLYQSQYSMGNVSYDTPVKNVRNLDTLDPERREGFKEASTKHVYYVDNFSKNPVIGWDSGLFKGQPEYQYPKIFDNPSEYQVSHLNTVYELLANKSFSMDNMLSFDFIIAPLHTKNDRDIIEDFCAKQSIQVSTFRNYSYDLAMRDLIQCSPFFVRCTEDGLISHDGEPLKKFISGFDLFSIVLLLCTFDSMELSSASFTKHHYNIWDELKIKNVERENISKKGTQYKDDFGCILFSKKSMTADKLNQISLELGPVLHFSYNKNIHEKLADNCYQNDGTRLYYTRMNQRYSSDIEKESISNIPLETTKKRITLSYWSSSISTGVNLQNLNVCSVDFKYSIPFTFIPLSKIKNNTDLKDFIQECLCESIIQKLSRICRGKGGPFKYLILTRDRDEFDLKEYLLSSEAFISKFRKFKVYSNVELSKIELGFLKTLKNIDRPLLQTENKSAFPEMSAAVLPIEALSKDVSHFIEGLDTNTKESYKQGLTRSQSHLKLLLKSNKTPVKFSITDWFGHFEKFTFTTITITVSKSNAILTYSNVESNTFHHLELTDDNIQSPSVIGNFIKEILTSKTVLLGFNSNKHDGPILNSLIKNQFKDIKSLYDYKINLETRERVSIKDVNSLVYKMIDLRVMCGKPRNRLSTFDVGSQLNSIEVPLREDVETIDNIESFNEIKLKILKDLYFDLFREENILIFDSYLKLLMVSYDFSPNFDYLVDMFTGDPLARWRELYLSVLRLKGSKCNLNSTTPLNLECGNIKEIINDLDWHDLRCKDALLEYYSKPFFYKKGEKGFYDSTNKNIELILKFQDKLTLKLSSGGCHSINKNVCLKSSTDCQLYDFDIQGFYGNVVNKYNLLETSPLGEFLKDLVAKRGDALENNEYYVSQAYKIIINVIMGDLGSSHSKIFNPQIRFELIQISQIIICNLIDLLVHHNLSIYAVNTDGFMVKTSTEGVFEKCVNNWEIQSGFKTKLKPLQSAVIKQNSVSRIGLDGQFFGSGFNYTENITPLSSFSFRKPLIIKDILENRKLPDKEISLSGIRKFIFTVKKSNQYTLYLDENGEKELIGSIRYAIGLNTKYNLYKKTKGGVTLVHKSIIPLNKFEPVLKYSLDIPFYKNLARKESSSLEYERTQNFLDDGSTIKDSKKLKKPNLLELEELFMKYRDNIDFVPVFSFGYPKGSLQGNVIKEFTKDNSLEGLAVFINPTKYFVIDFDSSSLLPTNIKNWVLENEYNLCISYHTKIPINLEEVIKTKPFKIFFKCNKEIEFRLKELVKPYLGIKTEIKFSRAFTVFGNHREGKTKYDMKGGRDLNNLELPSEEFIELLFSQLETFPQNTSAEKDSFIKNSLVPSKAQEFMKYYIKKNGEGFFKKLASDNSFLTTSSCPNSNLHTKGTSHSKEFSLKYFIKTHTLVGGCFHNSCTRANGELLEKLFVELFEKKTLATGSETVRVEKSDDTEGKPPVVLILENSDDNSIKLKEMGAKNIKKYKQLLTEVTQTKTPNIANKLRSSLRYYRKNFYIPTELKAMEVEKVKTPSLELLVLKRTSSDKTKLKQMKTKNIEKYKQLLIEITQTNVPEKVNSLRSSLRYYQNTFYIPKELEEKDIR
jgi:hypothetical protein